MSHTAIVPDHASIRNHILQHRLPLYFSKPVLAHIETYMAAATAKGFRSKVVDLAEYSACHIHPISTIRVDRVLVVISYTRDTVYIIRQS
ncbi:hypothetical protein ACFOQM_22305 [Paenibacillus sp. GCM10012307]|uniref:Uncharacterized protein n=1 Tax=Paenibacillus roseus TaxID=2798579 RepID=A0A934J8V9_9BACL|nr:hypothetical protein [Paenibacillus roseus]MBJ6363964.1 hypothetical protein [Paenibacillus roseus]